EVTGDTLEEKVKSAANIEMAKAMTEQGVSYMEYAIRVGDQVITGSTAAMKIKEMTFVLEENEEIAHMLCVSFAGISVIMMVISAVTVILMLAILMASTIRNQYRELGIMKGIGYTSKELMLQMAFRIIPVAVLGVAAGTVLAILLMQVVNAFVAKVALSAPAILAMDLAILVFTFACAFISAGKIKKISVYELITE
ncbi:MAG: ABC transporter permease, partial [Lachnospiraceae bacterium]|nr:ABC transporter permease [Lachnospiraceae bacterium]